MAVSYFMLMAYEIFTILSLLIAGATGMLAINSLNKTAKEFSLFRIHQKGIPFYNNQDLRRFLIYFVLLFSTVGSFLAAFLRFTWLNDIGWDSVGNEWAVWWLSSHALDGLTYTGVHLLIYMRERGRRSK